MPLISTADSANAELVKTAARCETISAAVLYRRLGELQAAKFIWKDAEGHAPRNLGRTVYKRLIHTRATNAS